MHIARYLFLTASAAPAAVYCNTIHNFGHDLDPRDKPDYAQPGRVDLADAGSIIIKIIQSTVKGQQKQRAAYTIATAQELRKKYPDKNVVIFHNQKSTYDFVDGEHFHHEVDLYRSLGTYGFEIWIFDSGTFHLAGDGGHMNWSFAGHHTRMGDKDVEFFPIDALEIEPPGLPDEQPLPPPWPMRKILRILGGGGGGGEGTWSRRRHLDPEDGNYFVDCRDDADGTVSSGIVYYNNLVSGQMVGKIPDDYVEISRGENVDWESVSSVHFPTRNITLTWSILGDSENAKLDESCGVASNGHERFWLYRSPGAFLFADGGKRCDAMYWGF